MKTVNLPGGVTATIPESATVGDTKDSQERMWRDTELKRTDSMLQPDRPDYQAILDYRQALRDYPQQPDFPNGQRPSM